MKLYLIQYYFAGERRRAVIHAPSVQACEDLLKLRHQNKDGTVVIAQISATSVEGIISDELM